MKTVKLNIAPDNFRLMRERINGHKRRPTKAEAHVLKLVHELGEPFVFQKGICTGYRFFIVDFYFPKPRKLCLEIDGPYHENQLSYDSERTRFLIEKRKMRVLRLSNDHALSLSKEQLLSVLDFASQKR